MISTCLLSPSAVLWKSPQQKESVALIVSLMHPECSFFSGAQQDTLLMQTGFLHRETYETTGIADILMGHRFDRSHTMKW